MNGFFKDHVYVPLISRSLTLVFQVERLKSSIYSWPVRGAVARFILWRKASQQVITTRQVESPDDKTKTGLDS